MGLFINYELRLDATVTATEAAQRLRRLRRHARTLKPSYVSPILSLTASQLLAGHEHLRPFSFERIVHIYAESAWKHRGGTIAGLRECSGWVASAFMINPGQACESAFFGLVQPVRGERSAEVELPEDLAEADNWFWRGWCKTQYASSVSDEHLVRCHLMVASVLDTAQQLGFGVTVRDETRYWETRSTDVLIAEVHRMNQIVARFAGAFHDAAPTVPLEGAIFEHPDFERLESEPIKPK